jgi:hypothetical protein
MYSYHAFLFFILICAASVVIGCKDKKEADSNRGSF